MERLCYLISQLLMGTSAKLIFLGGDEMSAETLSLITGTLLSLSFSYVPGIHNWYSNFDPSIKRLIMLGLLLLVSGSIYGLSCIGWASEWGITITCSNAGLLTLIQQTVIAIIANQSVYTISPQRKMDNIQEENEPVNPDFD